MNLSTFADDTLYIYPSANNCSNFLVCLHHEEFEFSCLQAPLFGYPETAVCTDPCKPKSSSKKSVRKAVDQSRKIDLSLYPDEPGRSIVCPKKGKSVARILQSCQQYVSCENGIATKITCDDGKEFSPNRLKCVDASESECTVAKQKGVHHSKCRYNISKRKIYFSSDRCDYFRKCENGLAFEEKCAEHTFWDPDAESCGWGSPTKCLS